MARDPFGRQRIDPEEEFRRAVDSARRNAGRVARLIPAVIGLLVLLWLATGIYIVNPGEQGIVRHFGREIDRTSPGLRYHLPWPVQQVDVVNVEAVRRIEVGFRTQQGQPSRVPHESLMLTGDENIVDAQLIVQYRVGDPSQYLFRLRNPEETLTAATEVAIRSVVGNMTIDDVLTTGRAEAQDQTFKYLQGLMNDYQSGLLITDVRLLVVDPPDQVKDAFNEVVRAREDRERQQNEAQAYREDIVPKARGAAEQAVRAAEAYREERVLQAQGDVSKFLAVLEEYRKGREVTRERLYLETVERVLSNVRKVVVAGSVGERAMPFLPLTEITRSGTPPAQALPVPQIQPPAPGQPGPAPQSSQSNPPSQSRSVGAPTPTAAPRR